MFPPLSLRSLPSAILVTAALDATFYFSDLNEDDWTSDVSATFQSDVSTAATVPTDQVTVSTASMTTRRRLLLEAPMSAEARHLLATCSGTCLSTTISIIWFASGSPHATTRPAAWAQRARGRMPPALVAQFHVLSAASLDGSRNETVQPSVGSRHCGMRLSNPQPVSCSLAAERGRPAESLGFEALAQGAGGLTNTAALLLMNSPSDIFKQSASFVLRTATVVTGNVMSWGAISVSTPSFPSPPPNPPPAPPACTVDPCYPGVACQSTNDFELAPEGWICGECPSGLDGNGIGELGCDDVDECNVTPNGGCDNVTACVNDFGGFHCTECPTGTSGTGLLGCVDDNECLQSNGGCDYLTQCINIVGSRMCGDCPSGYTGDGETGCVDINECDTVLNGGCDALTSCINKAGSSTCTPCPEDYTGDGKSGCKYAASCTDTGEEGWAFPCALPEIPCDDSSGRVQCGDCPQGFVGVGSKSCSDADGCADKPCFYLSESLNVPCIDIPAPNVGYDCFSLCDANGNCCPDGYIGDGMTCIRDLCATNEGCHPMASSCSMLSNGEAQCGVCVAGYEVPSDYTAEGGNSVVPCVDIDECAIGNGGCYFNSECINSPGGYSCGPCPDGYRGDGVTCNKPTTSCSDNNGGCYTNGNMLAECFDRDADGFFVDPYCGACPTGYDGDGITCVDTPGCFPYACFVGEQFSVQCLDVAAPGTGFQCADCPSGYLGDGLGNASGVEGYSGCFLNKCFNNNGGCSNQVTCTNNRFSVSGRDCGPCPVGYRDVNLDGTVCVDNDGCDETFGAPCFAGVPCTDVVAPGTGRTCGECPSGYEGDGATCTDVDECASTADPPLGGCYRDEAAGVFTTCTNILKGRTCGPCPAGYKGSGETTCELITTCAVNNGGCWYGRGDEAWASTTCTDDPGVGTDCGPCPAGFTGSGETGCVDTDGCAQSPCFTGVQCTDVKAPGDGHVCTYEGLEWRCPEGYKGNGMECTKCSMISQIIDSTILNGKTSRSGYDKGERALIVGQLDGLDNPTNCTNLQGTAFRWQGTASDGSTLALTSQKNKANTLKLNLPKQELVVKLNYKVSMTAYLVGNPAVSFNNELAFYVESLPLEVKVLGGNMLTGEENQLVLDASMSSDPDGAEGAITYTWRCFRDDQADVCRYRPGAGVADGDAVPIPASMVNESISLNLLGAITGVNYTFSCKGEKGERSTTSTVWFTIYRGKPPMPVIQPLAGAKANPTAPLVLTSSVESDDPEYLSLQWSMRCEPDSVGCAVIPLDATTLMTPTNIEGLVVRAGVLSAGSKYIFTLSAEDRIGPSSAEIEVTLNIAPQNGVFFVTPATGVSLETLFSMAAPKWEDDDVPLQFQFQYRVEGTNQWVGLINDFTPLPDPQKKTMTLPEAGLEDEGERVELRVAVKDLLGAISYGSQYITVSEPASVDTEAVMEEAEDCLRNGDTDCAITKNQAILRRYNAEAYVDLGYNISNATSYYNATDRYWYVWVDEAAPARRSLLGAAPKWETPERRRSLLQARAAPPGRRHLLQDSEGQNVTEDLRRAQRESALGMMSATADMLYATTASTDTLAGSVGDVVGVPTELTNETQAAALSLLGGLIGNTADATNEAAMSSTAAAAICGGLSSLTEAVPSNGTEATEASAARTTEAAAMLSGVGASLLSGAVAGMDASEVTSPMLALKVQRDRADGNSSRLYSGPITAPGSSSGVQFPAALGANLQGQDDDSLNCNATADSDSNSTDTDSESDSESVQRKCAPTALTKQTIDLQLLTTASDAHFKVKNVSNATADEELVREALPADTLAFVFTYREELRAYIGPEVTETLIALGAAGKTAEVEALLLSLVQEFLQSSSASLEEFLSTPPEPEPVGASGTVSISLKGADGKELGVSALSVGMNLSLTLAEGLYGTVAEIEARGLAWEGRAQCSYWDEGAQEYATDGCTTLPNPGPVGAGLDWRSLTFADFGHDLARAWTVMPEFLGECVEVWDAALLEWNGTDAGYRKYLNYSNFTFVEVPSAECPITDPNNTAGCYWEWTSQSFAGPGCVVANTQVCLCNHLTDFKAEVNSAEFSLAPPVVPKQPSPASLSLADILGSVVLLGIAGGIMGGACFLAVSANTGDTKQRQTILESLIAPFGTGIFGYRVVSQAWTWSLFEEDRLEGLKKNSAQVAKEVRKKRKAKKDALVQGTLDPTKGRQLRLQMQTMRLMMGGGRGTELTSEQQMMQNDELLYDAFHRWKDYVFEEGYSDSDTDSESDWEEDGEDEGASANKTRAEEHFFAKQAARRAAEPAAPKTRWQRANMNLGLMTKLGGKAASPPQGRRGHVVSINAAKVSFANSGALGPAPVGELAFPPSHAQISDVEMQSQMDGTLGLLLEPLAAAATPSGSPSAGRRPTPSMTFMGEPTGASRLPRGSRGSTPGSPRVQPSGGLGVHPGAPVSGPLLESYGPSLRLLPPAAEGGSDAGLLQWNTVDTTFRAEAGGAEDPGESDLAAALAGSLREQHQQMYAFEQEERHVSSLMSAASRMFAHVGAARSRAARPPDGSKLQKPPAAGSAVAWLGAEDGETSGPGPVTEGTASRMARNANLSRKASKKGSAALSRQGSTIRSPTRQGSTVGSPTSPDPRAVSFNVPDPSDSGQSWIHGVVAASKSRPSTAGTEAAEAADIMKLELMAAANQLEGVGGIHHDANKQDLADSDDEAEFGMSDSDEECAAGDETHAATAEEVPLLRLTASEASGALGMETPPSIGSRSSEDSATAKLPERAPQENLRAVSMSPAAMQVPRMTNSCTPSSDVSRPPSEARAGAISVMSGIAELSSLPSDASGDTVTRPDTAEGRGSVLPHIEEEMDASLMAALPQTRQAYAYEHYKERKIEMKRNVAHIHNAVEVMDTKMGAVGRQLAHGGLKKFIDQKVQKFNELKHGKDGGILHRHHVLDAEIMDQNFGRGAGIQRIPLKTRRVMAVKIKCFAVFVRKMQAAMDARCSLRLMRIMNLSLSSLQMCIPMDELRAMARNYSRSRPHQHRDLDAASMLDGNGSLKVDSKSVAGTRWVNAMKQVLGQPPGGSREGSRLSTPDRENAPLERLLGTALVLAYLDNFSVVTQPQIEHQLEKAKWINWEFPSSRPFEWYVKVFKVLLEQNRGSRGWVYRTALWNLVLLQHTDGSFEITAGLATTLHAGDTSTTIATQVNDQLDPVLIVEAMPNELRTAVKDKRLREKVWATLLAVERYRQLPFGWALNPDDLWSEQRMLDELAMQWLAAQRTQYPKLTEELQEAMQKQAREKVLEWHTRWLDVILEFRVTIRDNARVAERELSEAERHERNRNEWQRTLHLLYVSHPWIAIKAMRCTEAFTRAQRTLVLANTMLLMLLSTLLFFYNQGVSCCIEYKQFLGCEDVTTTSYCWGYVTCSEIYTAQEEQTFPEILYQSQPPESEVQYNHPDDWQLSECKAFPNPKNFGHKAQVAMITVMIQLPPTLFFSLMFTLAGTPSVPGFWRKSKKHRKLMGSSKATRWELLAYFIFTFLLDTQRLSRAIARYFLLIVKPLFESIKGLSVVRSWLELKWKQNKQTAWFLWQTQFRGRDPAVVFSDLEVAENHALERQKIELATLSTFQVVRTSFDSLIAQVSYVCFLGFWCFLLTYLLTYAVAIRDMLGEDAETLVLTNWVVSVIIDQFGIHVVKTFAIKSLVKRIMVKLQERAKGEVALVTWYETYITMNLQPVYTVEDDTEDNGAVYDTGMDGMDVGI
ncbi:hypothetical protein CYMTET_8493 [Cymbomonas tetramitiformis]|uniref:Uncharacterized protein n=1 Tax=Cymbomonas tetramitiformis TaxID=36881 RepID=A0AAE0GTE5_9CHLO|nr:hypothetical protein CYMTET_8493 [Cymbomonas tetramitiformis]